MQVKLIYGDRRQNSGELGEERVVTEGKGGFLGVVIFFDPGKFPEMQT